MTCKKRGEIAPLVMKPGRIMEASFKYRDTYIYMARGNSNKLFYIFTQLQILHCYTEVPNPLGTFFEGPSSHISSSIKFPPNTEPRYLVYQTR